VVSRQHGAVFPPGDAGRGKALHHAHQHGGLVHVHRDALGARLDARGHWQRRDVKHRAAFYCFTVYVKHPKCLISIIQSQY